MAMYDAKERGRDRLSLIGPGDLQPERVRARIALVRAHPRRAERRDGFVLYEQPIVRLVGRRGRPLRAADPHGRRRGEAIPPAGFLAVAERYGQIQAIDRWVVEHAIELLAAAAPATTVGRGQPVRRVARPTRPSSTSSSPRSRNATIDPSRLIFEVTETAAIANLDRPAAGRAAGRARLRLRARRLRRRLRLLRLPQAPAAGRRSRSTASSSARCASQPADQVTVRAIVDIARGPRQGDRGGVRRGRADARAAAHAGGRPRAGLPHRAPGASRRTRWVARATPSRPRR